MKALQLILKWLLSLWNFDAGPSPGIDSHKWESKIEIITGLRS